jgi:energy-coupling factor transport system permease protein
MIVPLFIAAFHRADELALAMEARGYHGTSARTCYREFRFASRDLMVMCLCAAAAMATWYFRMPADHANL